MPPAARQVHEFLFGDPGPALLSAALGESVCSPEDAAPRAPVVAHLLLGSTEHLQRLLGILALQPTGDELVAGVGSERLL